MRVPRFWGTYRNLTGIDRRKISMRILRARKDGCWWVAAAGIALLCIAISVVVRIFPLILITPPAKWPSLVQWYWSRSHIPGISPLPPQPSLAISSPSTDVILKPNNIPHMRELARFTPAIGPGPVAAMRIIPDGQALLAVYARETLLYLWHIQNGTPIATFDMGLVGVALAVFDGKGQILATVSGQRTDIDTADDANMNAVRLWNTQTGELIWDLSAEFGPRQFVSGIALSEDGQWLAAVAPADYAESRLYICSTVDRRCTFMTLEGALEVYIDFKGSRWVDERRIWQTPKVVALDRDGEIVALADREGRISLYWRDVLLGKPAPRAGMNIDWEKANNYTTPLALEFARSRRWLAIVRDEQFEVWSLAEKYVHRTLLVSIPTGPVSDIAFNPTDDLVAVGTSKGWQIWDTVRAKKLAEGGDSPIVALTFSSDGRLFAWGGEDGLIHIWGIPIQ